MTIRCIKMMESFKVYQVVRTDNEYGVRPVDSVPADSVCTIYFGGNGIVTEDKALRLGIVVDHEVLRYVADVPNYVVVYDSLMVADNRGERLVEMDKSAKDVLPRTSVSATVYLNDKNLDVAYRRRVLPLLIHSGPVGIMRIQFAIDGDWDEIVAQLIGKVRRTMGVLGFQENVIFSTMNFVLRNCSPYTDFAPPYPQEMFEQILLPRISDGHGHRIDLDTALRNVRKINILAQCHGGHVVRMMEKSMYYAMRKMGYTEQEIKQIMAQVLVAAYAPSCALGDSKFQFISFMSAYDYVVDVPNNWVFKYISDNRLAEAVRYSNGVPNWEWNLPPMFLSGRNGNVFVVKQRFKTTDGPNNISDSEHVSVRYFPTDATDDGMVLGLLAHNVVANGIKNSLAQDSGHVPLPPISELILNAENAEILQDLFADMTAAGQKFMDDVHAYACAHNAEIRPPAAFTRYKQFSDLKR